MKSPPPSAQRPAEDVQMLDRELTDKIAAGNGFIAALDQSGGSTPKALEDYGIGRDAWTSEEEIFGLPVPA